MTLANLRVVQGADRGRVYLDLKLPFTVGREEGNAPLHKCRRGTV
jgi:hypothetical protein